MNNTAIVQSKAFSELFLKHCISENSTLLTNEESAKNSYYFEDQSKSSNAFNQYLKSAYAFFSSDAGLMAVNDEICFLIDSENTLVILGTNPLMMVFELESDELNYGFSKVVDIQRFKDEYVKMFGEAQTTMQAGGFQVLYSKLPVWCPGVDTAFRDES